MKVYLVNKNPIIAKLVALSASKAHLELIQSESIEVEKEAGILLVDDESYDEELFLAYKQAYEDIKTAFFYSKSGERVEGFNEYIQKPFLPTDLFNVLNSFTGGFEFAKENLLEAKETQKEEKEEYEDIVEMEKEQEADFSESDFVAQEENQDNKEQDSKESVLDLDEINTLKELLDEKPQGDLEENSLDIEKMEEKKEEVEDFSLDEFGIEENQNPSEAKEEADEDFDLDKHLEGLLDESSETKEEASFLEDENILESKEKEEQAPKDKEEDELADLGFEEGVEENAEEKVDDLEELLEGIDSFDEAKLEEGELAKEEISQALEEDSKEQDLGGSEGLEDFNLDALDELPMHDLEEETNKQSQEQKEEFTLEDLGGIEEALDNNQEDSLQEEMIKQEVFSKEEALELEESKQEEVQEEVPAQEIQKEVVQQDFSGEEDFSALSLEGLSEALGEPIAKEPNITPIVPQNEERKISGDLQVNSIESLMVALQSLQTQGLKELLSGATINISIQFPKKEQE